MARHRRHRTAGLVKFPGLGALKVSSSVKPVDVAVGVAMGAVGTVAVGKAIGALATGTNPIAVPTFITNNVGIVGGLAAGGVAYLAQKKKNPARASAHLVGSVLGSAAVWIFQQTQPGGLFPMAGLINLPGGYGRYAGPIFSNPQQPGHTPNGGVGRMGGFRGPIFANPQTNMNLGRLASMQGVGDDNEDGLFPAP
jgi:hypothetical protein